MPPALYNLAHFGRHESRGRRATSMLVTARDPTTLSPRFRSQCTVLRVFRTEEPAYVDYFAGRIGKENAVKLTSLPPFCFLLYRDGAVTVCGGRRL